nr:NAD(P)-dependent oxidoreductase [Eisenbergiella sp. OF01-20]
MFKSGKIAGAASDVFETEPSLKREHPLLNCPNMIVLPIWVKHPRT